MEVRLGGALSAQHRRLTSSATPSATSSASSSCSARATAPASSTSATMSATSTISPISSTADWSSRPSSCRSIFGILGGIGADMRNLIFMKGTADRLFGDDYRWSVLAAGRHQMPFATQAAMMGGNVRVGLEDSLYIGPRQARCQQRRAGHEDPAHHRGTRLRGRNAGGSAGGARVERRRQGRGVSLGSVFARVAPADGGGEVPNPGFPHCRNGDITGCALASRDSQSSGRQ